MARCDSNICHTMCIAFRVIRPAHSATVDRRFDDYAKGVCWRYAFPHAGYMHFNTNVIVFIKNQLLPHFKCRYLVRGVFIVNVWVALEVLAFHEIPDV
jgi:hypothetical protein